MGRNTGGLHCQDGNTSNLGNYLRACRDAGYPVGLIKVLSDIGSAALAKEISPNTFTVWRKPVHWSGKDDQDNPPLDQDLTQAQIEAIAARWMGICYQTWRSPKDYLTPDGPKVYQYIDVFEITNEANPVTERDIKNYDAFFVACMKHAEAQPENFKLALWSFSAGCPEPEVIEWMRPSLTYAYEHGHALAVHEGAVDDEKRLLMDNWNGVPEQGTSLRYRMFYNHLGFCPKVVITETYQIDGYQHPDWNDWQEYLTELGKDNYVVGCGWFTEGDYSFSPGQSVNINNVLWNEDTGGFATPCIASARASVPPVANALDLGIPFLSQNNPTSANESPNDCGAACLAMDLNALKTYCTVNEVWERSGAGMGYMTFANLQTAATSYGDTLEVRYNQTIELLRAALRNGELVILLVNATYLWQPGKANPYLGAHFVVASGMLNDGTIVIHDPNNLPFTPQENLAEAWGNCHLQDNPDYAMLVLHEGTTPPPPPVTTPALSGVGMGNAAPLTPPEIEALRISKIAAFKALTIQDSGEAAQLLSQVRSVRPDMFIMARLMFPPNSDTPFTPQMFVDYVGNPALAYYTRGVQHFEIHNEVNLTSEGCFWNWLDGAEFSEWFRQVYILLRRMMPNAKLGFPGLSPQVDDIDGVCIASDEFLQQARNAVISADFLCQHSYFQDRGTGHWQMSSEDFGGLYWKRAQRAYPNKKLYLTEYSCNNPAVSDRDKGLMYLDYLKELSGIEAAFAFALSWPGSDVNHEGFVRDGVVTDIPRAMG